MLKLGEQIKESRIAKGMTQEELAKLLGLTKATINKYEKGTIKNIPSENIQKIENALFVSFDIEQSITFKQNDYSVEVWEIIKRLYKLKKENKNGNN